MLKAIEEDGQYLCTGCMAKAELTAENETLKARIVESEAVLKKALAQLEAKGRAGKRRLIVFSLTGDHKLLHSLAVSQTFIGKDQSGVIWLR